MARAEEQTVNPITEADSIISLAAQTKEGVRNEETCGLTVPRPPVLYCQYVATV
jgi:hypothetical protein